MFEDEEQENSQGVYGDEGREDLMGNDEISPEEEAFMSGYDTEEEKKENPEDLYDKAFDDASHQNKGGKKSAAVKPKKAASKKAVKAKKAKTKPKKPAKKKSKVAKKKAKAKPKQKPIKKKQAKKPKPKPKKPAKKKKSRR
jgi:outer membrane biosynthesis protein TonB